MLSTDNEADKIFELTIEEEERMRGGVGVSVGGGWCYLVLVRPLV